MRLKPPDLDDLDAEQQRVADLVLRGPRGGVRGPLAVWLHSADLAGRAQALGEYCRYRSALEPRLSELAILVTGRAWSAEYEWNAHAPIAIEAGISSEAVEAIRTGASPAFVRSDEEAVYDFASELHASRQVSDKTYARALVELGNKGVVDLVGLLGYYTLISMTINVFEVPLPEGATPRLGADTGPKPIPETEKSPT